MSTDHPGASRRWRGMGLGLLALAIGLLVAALPGIASASDRNNDRIPDRWEKRHGLSLRVNQARRDQDRDKLVNRQEWKAGDDPLDDDSDDDGIEDGDESAGTISSFNAETGELTIDVFGDGQVTGLVTDDTEIECDNGDDHGDEDGDDEGDGDHSGPGDGEEDDESGDDEADDKGDVSDDESGDDDAQDDEDGDDGHECSVDDLVEGATVQEAELEIQPGVGLVFEEIELLTSE